MRRWRSCDQADCEKNRDGDRHGSQVDLASPGGPISQGERLARHLGSISQGVGGVPMVMPFSQRVLKEMEGEYKFEKENALKALKNNKHNHVTTTYYLLL